MARIVAIANQKGGVGKTTTAVNLSACLADAGHRVLLVDIDPQGNSTSGLGIDKNNVAVSVYECLIGSALPGAVIVPTTVDKLHILPSTVRLAGAEIELVSALAREHILKNLLAHISDRYDLIFIDCPPSLGLLTLNALTSADSVLVPIQCEYYAMEGLTQLMNTVRLVKKRLNPGLDIEGVVLTMLDGRTNLGYQVVEEVRKFFKSKVYSTIVPRNVRLSEAPSHGQPIHVYDPRSSGAEAYRALAAEFIKNGVGVSA